MELDEFVSQVSGFDAALPGEKIRLFGWFLHSKRNLEVFGTAQVRECFERLHIPVPNVAMYLIRMTESSPPKALRSRGGYKLTRTGRADLDAKYSASQSFVLVSKLLTDLPGKIPDVVERNFLSEAIKCYQVGAFRACVVMTWNLTYSHLLEWIVADAVRLGKFNAAISKRFPKKPPITIATYDDFSDDLKESEVVEICGAASVLNSNVVKILKEKLGKRNIAAHPSSVTIVQSQADDVITDLVNNVVLALQ